MQFKHLITFMKIKSSDSIMLANTLQQLSNTVYKEFVKMLPRKIIKGKLPKVERSGGELFLGNGHRIIFAASNDENKLRSLTLVVAHLEEANGIDESVYNQMAARIRASSGGDEEMTDTKLRDLREKHQQVSITTNTDDGWTYDEAIGRDVNVKNYTPYSLPKSPRPTSHMFSSYVLPTKINRTLSQQFIDGLKERFSDVEYEIMVNANFGFKMGRIVKNIDDIVVENLENKVDLKSHPKLYGLDFGQGGKGDDQCLIRAHVDFEKRYVYITGEKEHKDSTSIDQKITDYYESILPENYDGVIAILYDKINGNKSGTADLGGTVADMYRVKGLDKLQPADNGSITNGTTSFKVNDRIELLLEYIADGRLFIDSKCEYLISQLRGWSWHPDKTGVPVDKDNHGIDAMIFILLRLGYLDNFKNLNYMKFIDAHALHSDKRYDGGTPAFMSRLGVGKKFTQNNVKSLYNYYD